MAPSLSITQIFHCLLKPMLISRVLHAAMVASFCAFVHSHEASMTIFAFRVPDRIVTTGCRTFRKIVHDWMPVIDIGAQLVSCFRWLPEDVDSTII